MSEFKRQWGITPGGVPIDEAVHSQYVPPGRERFNGITATELWGTDFSGMVMLHNTMRFDVQLSHIQPLIDEGDVDIVEVATDIWNAIRDVIQKRIGEGLDGIPVETSEVIPVTGSTLLYRASINVDLS
jgi:hypothetical protein